MSKDGGPQNDSTAIDDTFDALLEQIAQVSGPRSSSTGSQLRAGTVLLGGRLRVVQRIGEGGMGVVYEAHDAQRKARVALKTLSQLDAANVYRLKNEFRALADVRHENLVGLYELFAEDGAWFFTMELVVGERFDAWVRPGDMLDEQRLRAALPQLMAAMAAIHAAGKLHRDLKPSNVLVTPEGRVAVLDFGLAIDPEIGGVGQTVIDESISGTPGYMAPEQAAGRPATAASDFYALGVMLFEALTGRLPFAGHIGEILSAKQTRDAPRTSAFAQGLPTDLDALCCELLAREPETRPGEAALRIRVGIDATATAGSRLVSSSAAAYPSRPSDADGGVHALLGRESELETLRSAFAATQAGQPVVLFVSGESGMGKSALCTAFLNELRVQGRATVLSGRCYERENVPFKGFDALVDDLSRHLRKLPALESAMVLPREVFALARIFPVLDRIEAVAEAPKKHVPDPQDLKRRAFDAFGELLARMRDRAPLVLLLDDAQWLDQDSVRFLRALLVHPDPVPVLLLCAHRSEGAEQNALLQSVLQGARDSAKLQVRELRVGPLPHAALRVLAARLLPEGAHASAAETLAVEAQGSPFFAAELARAAALHQRGDAPPSLADAVSLHVDSLPVGARHILSLLAFVGQPLSEGLVVDTANTSGGHESLDRLRAEQLVRVSIDASGARSVECYHDKIREHLAAALEPLHARELALALARALATQPAANAELIARMLNFAGLPTEAAVHAASAAEAAFAALAFERSAQLYAQALEHGRFEPERLQGLRVGCALALAHAGRAEAADAYLSAAEHASADDALDLELKAGEQYLLRGDLERGRGLLDRALRRIGYSLPQSLPAALASVAWSRARLRMRGLRFVARAQQDPHTQRELELLRVTVHCLVRSDFIRGADFAALFVRRALDAGDAVEAARALSWNFFYHSMLGASNAQVEAAEALCVELCERTGDQLAASWLAYCRGMHLCLRQGRPEAGLVELDRMLAIMSAESFPSAGYDRAWAHCWRSVGMMQIGRIAEGGELAGAQYEDAIARGDHSVAGGLMQTFCYGLMAHGRVEQVERVLEETRARLRPGEITVPDTYWLFARLSASVYADCAAEVWDDTAEYRERYFSSWHGRRVRSAPMYSLAAGTAAEAALAVSDPQRRDRLRREARLLARRAAKSPDINSGAVPGQVLLACLDGDRELAIAAFRRSLRPPWDFPFMQHLFDRRLGELLGGDEGAALVAQADTFLRAGGVVDPARYVSAMVPGVVLTTER